MGIFHRKSNVEKLKATKDVEGLIKALKNKDKDIRIEAIEALSKIGGVRTIGPLIQALKDEDSMVQKKQ